MSLIVWLPLNGNLDNKGVIDWQPTGTSNINYVSEGKVGKALSRGGVTMPSHITSQFLNNNEFSYCCWIYVKGTSGSTSERAMIFGNDGMTPPNNRKFSIYQYPTCNDLHLSWQNDGSDTFLTFIDRGVLPSGKWTHLGIIYKNPLCLVYINGKLIKQYSGVSNSASFSFNTQLIHDSSYHYLNDIRLYNHALSSKEVADIAKGLCLHYRLAGPGGENLLTHSFSSDSNWGVSQSGGTVTKTVQVDYTQFNTTAISTSWHLYYRNIPGNVLQTLKPNTKYVFSFEAWSDKAITLGCSIKKPDGSGAMGNGNSISILGDSQWHRYTSIITTFSNFSSITIGGQYLYLSGGNVVGTIRFRRAKLEEGEIATPWCPNSADSLYSILGYDNNIEYDCSGFGYNGAKQGNIKWDSDTPRHVSSYNITNSNVMGPIPNILKPIDEITVHAWVKLGAENTSGEKPFICSWEGGGAGITASGSNYGFMVYSSGDYRRVYTDMTGKMTKWHMVTGTFDGNKVKIYIDGELKNSVDVTAGSKISYNQTTPWAIGVNPGPSGASGGITGKISDARVYATALTAEDVLELYNVAGNVDDDGNLYVYEYLEE